MIGVTDAEPDRGPAGRAASRPSRAADPAAGTVVVGAGMAGVQTAVALREQGYTGAVTLVGAEPHDPYDRPPLSKAVLLGKAEGSAFEVDFAEYGIGLRLGLHADRLDTAGRVLETDAGPVPYGNLVLATGAAPVPLPGAPAGATPGVHLLRTLDDAARLRAVLVRRSRVLVVGAGWIGAELTTAAREQGCEVTVVEAAGQPLAAALPAAVAAPMAAWYEESGARLLTGRRVERVDSDGEDGPVAVVLDDGTELTADAVVVGIGAHPTTAWLAGSGVGLGGDGAVRADERLRTNVPGVWAVGDCASFPSARYGERLLIHHWDNALQGPTTVAADIAGAPGVVYDPVPYFWSEQFGRFVQYVGHHTDRDELLWRGDPHGSSWSVCWLRAGRLIALLAVGRPRDLTQGRKLIHAGAALDRERAADAAVPLKSAAL
ncbi:NAD(P)/FAD-dependent oxidoreductase [Streptomyces sp. NPDC004134]|uniref:NAD(P)/FAD-dependent oxidoreductase n=1 Tax=Streptomyces sp. NPDC004134 TaxID=3364691 RepID=UPI0036A92070